MDNLFNGIMSIFMTIMLVLTIVLAVYAFMTEEVTCVSQVVAPVVVIGLIAVITYNLWMDYVHGKR